MRLAFGNYLSSFLLLVCVLFAGGLAVKSYRIPHLDIEALLKEPSAPSEAVRISRQVYTPPQIRSFDAILKRPLFSENRKPPAIAAKQVSAIPARTPAHIRLELEGVAITTQARVAVLRDLTSKEMLRLPEGANHNGWKLESVQADRALFKRNQQTVELELELAENPTGQRTKSAPVQRTIPNQGGKPAQKTGNKGSASKQ